MTTAVRWVVIVLLAVHGLIHLLGAAKGFGWADVGTIRSPIGPFGGAVWLLAGTLVLVTAVMLAGMTPTWWWAVAAVAALVSQAVVLTSWSDAKAGTVANVVLLLVAVYGFASLGPPSYAAEWDRRADAALTTAPSDGSVVTEGDLAALPDPVARYVRRSGAVGQPRVGSFYAAIHGRIRSGPDKPWMPFTGRQLNTYGAAPQRLFFMDATMSGLPVTVLHVFDAEAATMRGKVLSLVPILDAKGPEMDRSEAVTMFNDLVVFAPGALVDAPVRWTELGPSRVHATYTRAEQTVTADLIFSPAGDLVDFVSHDRSRAAPDGTSFDRLPWNTPLKRYQDLHGRRVAVEGVAMWEAPAPEGHFTYIEFEVDDLAYNVTTPAIPSQAAAAEQAPVPRP